MRLLLFVTFAIAMAGAACAEERDHPPATLPAPTATATLSVPTGAVVCEAPYPVGTPTAATVFCADPSSLERAPVVRIVDGDTIRIKINGVEEPVRFYGIDTAERGDPCFDDATERTAKLAGSAVLLRTDARNRDGFDRLLRYVYTTDGLSIDALLVAEGLAYAWRDDGALREPLIALEDLARIGCLWADP
jgi:micrococcal nuclease